MHVSNLLSPTSAAPRLEARFDAPRQGGTRDSGFGAVYDAGRRPAAEPGSARRREREREPGEERAAAETEAMDAHALAEAAPVEAPAEAIAPEDTHSFDAANGETFDAAGLAAADAPTPVRVASSSASEAARATATAAAAAGQAAAGPAEAEEQPVPTTAPATVAAETAKAEVQAGAGPAVDGGEVSVRRVRADRTIEAAEGDEPRTASPAAPRTESRAAPPMPAAFSLAGALSKPAESQLDAAGQGVDASLAELGATEPRPAGLHPAHADAPARHAPAHPAAQQLAQAARALADGPVELTLKPEELGTVRMTLHAGPDGAMTMSLQAERPETLELLRRHIGELARELQDLGYGTLSFSFGQERPGDGRRPGPETAETTEHPVAAIPLAAQSLAARPAMTAAPGGLDLRL